MRFVLFVYFGKLSEIQLLLFKKEYQTNKILIEMYRNLIFIRWYIF